MTLSTRKGFLLIASFSFALVLGGLLIGEWLRISPCPLCIFQRLLYLAVTLVAIIGIALPTAKRLLGSLIALIAAGGMATAIYQSWIQLYPDLATQCGYGEPNLIEQLVDWLGMKWPLMFMATGFCTTKENILGFSVANWSILCFASLLILGVRMSLKNR